jgi:hypothetical protein
MYKSRFDRWGWGKNTLRQDWQAFVILRDRAKTTGTELCQVQIHGRIRNLAELTRYLRIQKISEADFLNEALEKGVSVPVHVQRIPAGVSETEQVNAVGGTWQPVGHSSNRWPDEKSTSLPQSPLDNAHQSLHGSSNAGEDSQLQHVYPHNLAQNGESSLRIHSHYDYSQSHLGGIPPELFMYLTQVANPMSGIMPPGPPFVRLSEMAGQFSVLAPDRVFPHNTQGTGRTHSTPNVSSPIFQSLSQIHQEIGQVEGPNFMGETHHSTSDDPLSFLLFTPIPGSVPDPTRRYLQIEEHHNFMGTVFMACMSAVAEISTEDPTQNVPLAQTWMGQAILKLKVMCAAQDPMFLVTIHMILVWLQVHDTESRAESIISELFQATAIELEEDSPIAIILECMTSAAGKRLPHSRIGLGALRRVVREFGAQLGPEHPHTLVAMYYMCFHMMDVEHKFAEAEVELKKLHESTSKILGQSSFQSICVLATLSRAQTRQGQDHAALDTINQCLAEAPLGLNHPHRLELLVRKALICWKLKDKLKPEEQAERLYLDAKIVQLYSIVARGRIATLGRHHKHTEAAHETLVEILVESRKYEMDAVKGEALELLTKPQVAVSDYERWWWTMVPKDRDGEEQQTASRATE